MTKPGVFPRCGLCRHFDRDPDAPPRCQAFPKRIPAVIWCKGDQHDGPIPGDQGIRFEPREVGLSEEEKFPGTEWRTINGRRVCISGDCPKGTRLRDLNERGEKDGKPGEYRTLESGTRVFVADPDPNDPYEIQIREVRKKVESEEVTIRNEPKEHAVCFDAETGEVVFKKVGEADVVSFTPDEARKFNHNISVHNHPTDNSFSNGDIIAAIQMNTSEFRVIGKTYRYSLKPGEAGWPDPYDLSNKMLDEIEKVRAEYAPRVAAGEISAHEAEMEGYHTVMERVAERSDGWIVYRREKR